MNVQILTACRAAGKSLAKGQVYDLPDDVAGKLVRMRRAAALVVPEGTGNEAKPATEPAPKKPGRPKKKG